MYKKTCPACQTISYSNTIDQTWLCPNCQHDITYIEAIKFFNNEESSTS